MTESTFRLEDYPTGGSAWKETQNIVNPVQ